MERAGAAWCTISAAKTAATRTVRRERDIEGTIPDGGIEGSEPPCAGASPGSSEVKACPRARRARRGAQRERPGERQIRPASDNGRAKASEVARSGDQRINSTRRRRTPPGMPRALETGTTISANELACAAGHGGRCFKRLALLDREEPPHGGSRGQAPPRRGGPRVRWRRRRHAPRCARGPIRLRAAPRR